MRRRRQTSAGGVQAEKQQRYVQLIAQGVTNSAACRRLGISRASYHRYQRRYLAEGVVGQEERSRRPHASPGQIDPGWS